jgi:small subunit ribosomal protein S13
MSNEYKHIVRLAGIDLDGSLKVVHALARIRGIGINTATAALRMLDIDLHKRIGFLNSAEIKKIESFLQSPESYNLPSWFVNRPKEPGTGHTRHLIGSDLVLAIKMDVDFMKKIKCWKGIRHSLGLKVRGQSTRTTGRTGVTVGVVKKPKG